MEMPNTNPLDEGEKESIEEFLASMDQVVPTIPDELLTYYLNKTGFVCPDIRVKRMIALATQKFVSDIANDALQYCKLRQQSPAYRAKGSGKGQRTVLTLEDLTRSLHEYGIDVKKPEYYVDSSSSSKDSSVSSSKDRKK
ncbi:Transcription initiation factor TFIID subunit 10 [Balamuthia mandrillaris]